MGMSRIPPAGPAQYEPVFGAAATEPQKVFAHSPEIAAAYTAWGDAVRSGGVLPFRLVELVRIRVAFHNQCRMCMSLRYADASGSVVDEGLVCSLEKPAEAEDLTDAERAALEFADLMATDHLSIGDDTFSGLRAHFDDAEIMELCFRVAANVGFGRMAAVLDLINHDELPEVLGREGRVAPWTRV
jgi:alkylhydroperoxidase family enzyme